MNDRYTFQERSLALVILRAMSEDERAKILFYHSFNAIIEDLDIDAITDSVLFYVGL